MRLTVVLAFLVLVAAALAGCGSSSSNGKDDDQDTMYDSTEKNGWDVTVDTLTQRTKHHVTSDPGKSDTDDDGIPDNEEYFLGIDPRVADTDGDSLTDCQETRHSILADCQDETFNGPFDGGTNTDPKSADSDPGASLYVLNGPFVDTTGTLADGRPESGDGISDGEELAGYTITLANGNSRTVKTNPRNGDSDGDNLDDGEERFQFQSDPLVQDTDGDGCVDGVDPLPGLAERYRPGLGVFTLKGDKASADVRLTVLLDNARVDAPDGSSRVVQNGQGVDFSDLEPAPMHSDQCTYTPRHPWVQFQVLPVDMRTLETLDVFSGTTSPLANSGQTPTVWWDVPGHRLNWVDDDAGAWDLAQGVLLQGADGSMTLHPALVTA